ncbi:MAG: ABC transporter ATP-binding protein [Gammaproteobacteria bacterium]|nr:ABC transporter ATP-binding protein [Gammaproteobacteria bacterium]MYD75081.1 ABC transporter ATP-binding protein [Gammaproteobacteria bacterium]MYJ51521.1 ABC transporter ATP-binding protein [Gammaproteobacteria bacterium]
MNREPLLEVRDLSVSFHSRDAVVHAVNRVNFVLHPGEVLGVVGESGSGKTVTMMALLGLLPSPPARISAEAVRFDGQKLLSLPPDRLRAIRGHRIGFIFQDPMTSLNPVLTVGYQIMEPMRHHLGLTRVQARDRAVELLDLVGIPDAARRLNDWPHRFSGGMRQRVMIALALACDPQVLVADEPTTALDVTIQAQILELVRSLREKVGMAIIWITHDLGVIAGLADRVMVMYAGQIVEQAGVGTLFEAASHPYTRALLGSVPDAGGVRRDRLMAITGQAAVLYRPPEACPFHSRCDEAVARCREEVPKRHSCGEEHDVACFRR